MRKRKLLANALFMSASALLLRFAGVSFNVWLSNRIGEAGMGLFQLISSAYMLAVTFATSGIRTATVRLLSEESALKSRGGAI